MSRGAAKARALLAQNQPAGGENGGQPERDPEPEHPLISTVRRLAIDVTSSA